MSARGKSSEYAASQIEWQGKIESVQCRAWVWRYKTDNRTHHHLGFNLFMDGEANGQTGRFIVAISNAQYNKYQFRIGDVFKGTAWPCIKARHDIADYYRAGKFKVLARAEKTADSLGPPFMGVLPGIEVFQRRGARMLNAKRWRKQCFCCIWANKSAVEIEYKFGKVKRYRQETFCYGPLSCPLYDMGPPRKVPYFDEPPLLDEGWMDDICTEGRMD